MRCATPLTMTPQQSNARLTWRESFSGLRSVESSDDQQIPLY